MLGELLLFGRGEKRALEGEPYVFKLLGRPDGDCYTLAVEVTDFSRAHVAKFTLEQLLDSLEDTEGLRPQPETMLGWLRSAFDGQTVQANAQEHQVVLVAPFKHTIEGEAILINLRLPPPNSKSLSIDDNGMRWVASDIVVSLLNARNSLSQQLAECESQASAQQQMASIMEFLSNGGVAPAQLGPGACPPDLGSPAGAATKPAAGAAPAAAPAATATAGVSGQTVQTAPTSQLSRQVSDTSGIVVRPGRGRGRGRGRALGPSATKIGKK